MNKFAAYFPLYLQRPLSIFRNYQRADLRADLLAALTVAIILLPQAIAFAIIAELPPQVGLYAGIMGALAGGLWGSSNQLHTGPVNAISLLVASVLFTIAPANTTEYVVAASMLALMAGVFQLTLGMARLGILVNFVSHSVIVGFSTGAGPLIALKQLRPLFGLSFSAGNLGQIIEQFVRHVSETHLPTMFLGFGTIFLILFLRKLNPKLPSALISMIVASLAVFFLGLDEAGVAVIGELPRSFPPLAPLPLFDLELISNLSTGALAVGALGLVQASAIARSMAIQTGQDLDSDQEFVGQGVANILSGLFSGYPVSASFTRSAVNADTGARTPLAALFSSIFVLLALFLLAPLAAFLPLSALAGVLIVTAMGLVDTPHLIRIWKGARQDGIIMFVTLLGTLFLRLDFAVLTGILLSFAFYLANTSQPRVRVVVPDENFRYFIHDPHKPLCPQLGVLEIQGDLYFGAVNHVEKIIQQQMKAHPTQRFLLLRMHHVNQCDYSGIRLLTSIVDNYRQRGGNVYLVRVRTPVLALMKSTHFYAHVGRDYFLSENEAIKHLFYRILDPAICIYECDVRVFRECQTLVRPQMTLSIPINDIPVVAIPEIAPNSLWQQLTNGNSPLVIDVREPREFRRAHIPDAQLIPLSKIFKDSSLVPQDQAIVFVCQTGRRSLRAAQFLSHKGYQNITTLKGGMSEWRVQQLLTAVEL